MDLSLATFAAALLAPLSAWYAAVQRTVQEPYIDEFFHVRQAQQYCNGRFDVWDPKITTPPGLYWLSYIASPALACHISALRLINVFCLIALLLVVYATYIERRKSNNETGLRSKLLAQHSALNVVLFPPLFFFSALYYTDVASTLSVAVFYWYLIRVIQRKRASFGQGCVLVLLGAISLTFRQTNIFWVAVAPAGLTLIIELDQGHRVAKESMYKRAEGFGDSLYSIIKTTWKMDLIYDPPSRNAYVEDYIRSVASIITRALKALTQPAQILHLLLALTPFVALLALFAAFVVWNGGIVLGDRSAHIATLHAAQMLYLWPYMTFFSWPLLLPHLLILPLMFASRLSEMAHFEPLIFFRRHYFLPRLSVVLGFTALAALIVHFNTVVHPYLLADNRHYPFYIFKRLLRPWWVRYAVTPIYVVCAWACVETRGEPSVAAATTQTSRASANKEAAGAQSPRPTSPKSSAPNDEPRSNNKNNANSNTAQSGSSGDATRRPLLLPDGKSGPTVSFIIVSLATSALQLCTAPLVEPRYFILPWLVWRMHLPLHAAADKPQDRPATRAERTWAAVLQSYDYRVVLETLWLLCLNAVLAYVFLYRGFTWPSEPTKVQRFMW